MNPRIDIASATRAGGASAASRVANDIGRGARAEWRRWYQALWSWLGRPRERAAPEAPAAPDPVAHVVDDGAVLDALENELRAVLATPPAALAVFLDGWLSRLYAVPPVVRPAQQVRLLIDGGMQYYLGGVKVARSGEPVARAIQLARDIDDRAELRRGLSTQAILLSSLGDSAGAMRSIVEALEIAATLDNKIGLAAAWSNAGLVFVEAWLHGYARACYERADRLACEAADGTSNAQSLHYENVSLTSHLRSLSLHGIALCHRAERDWARAAEACERATQQVAAPRSRAEQQVRALIEGTHAHALLELGRLDEAEAHARVCEDMAQRSGSMRARVTAGTVNGLVAVYQGRADEGLAQILALREKSRTIYGSIPDTLSALAQAYEHAGQEDQALESLQELLEFRRRARSIQLLGPFEALHRSLEAGATGPDSDEAGGSDTVDAARAAKLRASIDERLADLHNNCIANATRSGYDAYRVFRVGALVENFALSEGVAPEVARSMGFAARLCDLGMMVVPDELLRKPRGLSVGERKIFHEHTLFGAEVLTRARLAVLQPCVAVARYHHEKWDGRGPWGLKGEDIPLEARMTSLADALDSLTHPRPWRPAKSVPAALRIISEEAGTSFDPALAARFVAFVQREYWRHDDWDAYLSADAQDNPYVQVRAQLDRLIANGGEA